MPRSARKATYYSWRKKGSAGGLAAETVKFINVFNRRLGTDFRVEFGAIGNLGFCDAPEFAVWM